MYAQSPKCWLIVLVRNRVDEISVALCSDICSYIQTSIHSNSAQFIDKHTQNTETNKEMTNTPTTHQTFEIVQSTSSYQLKKKKKHKCFSLCVTRPAKRAVDLA